MCYLTSNMKVFYMIERKTSKGCMWKISPPKTTKYCSLRSYLHGDDKAIARYSTCDHVGFHQFIKSRLARMCHRMNVRNGFYVADSRGSFMQIFKSIVDEWEKRAYVIVDDDIWQSDA